MATLEELRQAKVKLYFLLVSKGADQLTETEVNVMYELAKDSEIRAVLNFSLQKGA